MMCILSPSPFSLSGPLPFLPSLCSLILRQFKKQNAPVSLRREQTTREGSLRQRSSKCSSFQNLLLSSWGKSLSRAVHAQGCLAWSGLEMPALLAGCKLVEEDIAPSPGRLRHCLCSWLPQKQRTSTRGTKGELTRGQERT